MMSSRKLKSYCWITFLPLLIPVTKANAFAKHYAAVGRHDFTREERAFHRDLKKLHAPSVDDQSCAKLTNTELRRAINKIRGNGSAGSIDDIAGSIDDIPPYFLIALGLKSLKELLGILISLFYTQTAPVFGGSLPSFHF